jgi:hypothetical protein
MPELLDRRKPIPEDVKCEPTDSAALVRARVIEMKTEGWSSRDIAKDVNLSETQVRHLIRQAVEAARAAERALITERYHVQDLRVEWLIEKIMGLIRTAPEFDERLLRQVIALFDRQAKLHGLDKNRTPSTDWLSSAPPDELLRIAKERGIKLPEKFTIN